MKKIVVDRNMRKLSFYQSLILLLVILAFGQSYGQNTKADYSYAVPDMTTNGELEINKTLEISDVATIGEVNLTFTWQSNGVISFGTFYVTSPAGTKVMVVRGMAGESQNINLTDFSGEDLAGDWIFTLTDQMGSGVHSVKNCVFNVNKLPTEPILTLNQNSWDAGEIQMGFPYANNEFVIENKGADTIKVLSISDLSGTDFSTSLIPGEVKVGYGEFYAFNFTYAPTNLGKDSVIFTLSTNDKDTSIVLKGQGINIADANFEEGIVPDNWTIVDNDGNNLTWDIYKPNVITEEFLAHSGDYVMRSAYNGTGADDYLILPKLMPTADNNQFFFWATTTSTYYQEDFEVVLSTTGVDVEDFTVSLSGAVEAPGEWLKYNYDLSDYNGQEVYVAIVHKSINKTRLLVDDVFAPIVYLPNDLALKSIIGEVAPLAGQENLYEIEVKNVGSNAQTDYQIKIFDGSDNELTSVQGTEIVKGELKNYSIPLTFNTETTYDIYAKVVLNGDENSNNDSSDKVRIYVQSESTDQVQVGTGNNLSEFFPLRTNFYASLTESVYYPHEINNGGWLSAISYDYNFETDIKQMSIKVRVGETDVENLEDEIVPASELNLVFEGNVSFKKGQNKLHIQFNEPYLYQGGNLVVMFERILDSTSYPTKNYFYATETPLYENRSRSFWSNTVINNEYPGLTGVIKAQIPNAKFFFDKSGLGFVQGTVFDELGNAMPEAELSLQGSDLTTQSDNAGAYKFSYLEVGSYEILAEKFGYNDSLKNIEITDQNTATVNFEMSNRPKVQVTGKLVKSDMTDMGLEGANVYLKGYANYSGVSDADGNFILSNVWGNTTYKFTVISDGYDPYQISVPLADINKDLGAIIINEIAYPVSNVLAELNTSNQAEISWNTPNPDENTKAIQNYTVYRLVLGQETNQTNWVELSAEQTDTTFTDTDYSSITYGDYLYAVVANYSNGVVSDPVFSNNLPKNMEISITINITTNAGNDAEGAVVTLEHTNGMHNYSATAPLGGVLKLDTVWRGTYIATVALPGFETFVDSSVVFLENNTSINVELIEQMLPPVNLRVDHSKQNAIFSWDDVQALDTKNKAVIEYQVYLNDTNTMLGSTTETQFEFVDLVEEQTYLAGVSAKYAAGLSKVETIEFTVPNFSQVSVTVTTNSDDAATGALATLKYAGEDNSYAYESEVTNEGLAEFLKILKGNYILSVAKAGYKTYFDSAFTVSNETEILSVELIENLAAPINLSIENSVESSILSWESGAGKSFVTYHVFIDDMTTAVGSTTELTFDISSLVNSGETYTIGVAAEYASGTSAITSIETTIPVLSTLVFNVTANAGSAEGAFLKLKNNSIELSDVIGASETVQFSNVEKGTYYLTINRVDYVEYVDTLEIEKDSIFNIELKEYIKPTYNPQIVVSGKTATFTWNTGEYFFEDSFDNGAFNQKWEVVEGSGTTTASGLPYWSVSDIASYDGNYAAVCEWGSDIDTWLISPEMFIEEGASVSFAWYSNYYWSVYPNNNSDLFVKISTDNGVTWEYIWTYGEIGQWDNYTWYETILSLDAYANQLIKVAFNLMGSDNSPNALDAIQIGNTPKAKGTYKLADGFAGNKQRKIPENSGVKSYEHFNIYLDDMDTPVTTTTENVYIFNNLDYNTAYTAGVSSVYSSGESEIASIEFETESLMHVITFNVDMSGLDGFNSVSDSVYVRGSNPLWTGPNDQLFAKLLDEDGDLIYTLETSLPDGEFAYNYELQNGTVEMEIQRSVVFVSDTVLNNQWGIINGIHSLSRQTGIWAYPNPANNMVTLLFNEFTNQVSTIEIINQQGRVVDQIMLPSNVDKTNYSVNHLPGGIYYLNRITNNTTQVIKLIIIE